MNIDVLRDRAIRWSMDDPDADDADRVSRWVLDGDDDELRAAFARPLRFGTAGLRGPMGPGPARMCVATVARAAVAVGRWLDDRDVEGPVVIGHDARHRSRDFAVTAARLLAGSGRVVVLAAEPGPTPLFAFAVRHLRAAAGLVVTASHNPPADNGLKVYADDGMQIVAPMDAAIAAHIDAIEGVRDLPRHDLDHRSIVELSDDVVRAYRRGVADLRSVTAIPALEVAYTPMHGVGHGLLAQTFVESGLAAPIVVPEQAAPDPDFPTLAFPNPEEPGAMDLVLALGASIDADLVLANDPDADRVAMAVPVDDGWRTLTGDETGVLLADHLLRHRRDDAPAVLASTVVSSSMLARLAEAHGAIHVETLTGFKWLTRAAGQAAREHGGRTVLAYEEAIGFCVGEHVLDKDGISAAVVLVEAVAALAAARSSVVGRLAELSVAHGLHRTRQHSVRFAGHDGPARMAAVVDGFRTDPPATLAGETVTSVEDLARGERLPPTDAVIVHTDHHRLVVRPSGTEPKLKLYLQTIVDVDRVDQVAAATADADGVLDAVLDGLADRLA